MKSLLFILAFMAQVSYAQVSQAALDEREGGGGNDTVAEEVIILNMIKSNLLKLEKFLRTEKKAQNYFSEIDQIEFSRKILDIVKNDKVKLVRDGDKENDNTQLTEIHDKYGVTRTAVNYPSENIIEYDFEKVSKLQDKPKILFVLNAHEILSLMKIEENDPNKKDQYMGYNISGRFSKFVTKVESYDLKFKEIRDSRDVNNEAFYSLEDKFHIADKNISLDDFKTEFEYQSINCAHVRRPGSGQPNPLSYKVFTFNAVNYGVPSQGPLFPGTSDREHTFISSYPLKNLNRASHNYEIDIREKEIIQVNKNYNALLEEVSIFRKNGDFIVIQYLLRKKGSIELPSDAYEYGYCW